MMKNSNLVKKLIPIDKMLPEDLCTSWAFLGEETGMEALESAFGETWQHKPNFGACRYLTSGPHFIQQTKSRNGMVTYHLMGPFKLGPRNLMTRMAIQNIQEHTQMF